MAQNILAPSLGYMPSGLNAGTSTVAMSAANTWFAMSFIGNGKTLSTVDMYASAITGAGLAANELTLDIYSTTSTGDPNASVSGPHDCGATPTATWLQWSPSYATTDGTMYWAVVKNIDGTPASNYPTFRYCLAGTGQLHIGSNTTLWGWNKNHTTDGSTWTAEQRAAGGMVLGYSDGSYEGAPFSNIAATGTGDSVYAARELGAYFTFAGPTLNVRGLAFFMGIAGTPTNASRARIYSGSSATPTLLATSTGGPVSGQVGLGWQYFPFASSQALAAGTYRVVLGTTGADTSSNRFTTQKCTVKNDAASRALMPFGASMLTYSTDGTTFAETNTELVPFALILDNGSEFTVSGGAGGMILGRCMNGGLV